MSILKFENITKAYYQGLPAVSDISFEINEGEFVFLVGPSGSGKSTIIKMIIRELSPDSGTIYFRDEDISALDTSRLPDLRRRIGIVFQDFRVLSSKTVFENVSVALEVVNASKREINEVVPNVLNMVRLGDKKDRFPNTLSGGELQRLCIARALAHEPDILLADEPTGMIDPKSAKTVLEILQKINDLGTTVIMATHDQHIVNSMKKRVLRIENGSLISDKRRGSYDE